MSSLQYVKNLDLGHTPLISIDHQQFYQPKSTLISSPIAAKEEESSTITTQQLDNMEAAVDGGSVISFAGNVDSQSKEDLLLSTLFAQRAANAKHDRYNESEEWYKFYTQVLNNIGWVSDKFAFTTVDTSSGDLKMDEAALKVIAAIATSNQMAALTAGLDALKSMADDSKQITLFDFNTSVDISGNFQLGTAEVTSNGALSLCLGAYHFKCVDRQTKFLFFTFGTEEINFWTAAQAMTLNSKIYAQLRDVIADRLADTADEFIANLAIA